jgi:hypothetical protein
MTKEESEKPRLAARHLWLTPIILAQANSSQDPISKITRAK